MSTTHQPGRAGRARPEPTTIVGALRKGLEILDLFTRERAEIGIGEMADALGIHKSTASRLAATLAGSGYLQAASGPGSYRLGPRLVVLGTLAGVRAGLAEVVMPHLEELVRVTGETGHLAILAGADAATVGVVDGWHTVRMHSWVGKKSPAYCSSMGKALLAGLPRDAVLAAVGEGPYERRTEHTICTFPRLLDDLALIRERGHGLDREELEYGLCCVSAPVFAADGHADASISISGPTQRMTPERVEELAVQVRWAAWQASLARGCVDVAEGWAPAPTQAPPARG